MRHMIGSYLRGAQDELRRSAALAAKSLSEVLVRESEGAKHNPPSHVYRRRLDEILGLVDAIEALGAAAVKDAPWLDGAWDEAGFGWTAGPNFYRVGGVAVTHEEWVWFRDWTDGFMRLCAALWWVGRAASGYECPKCGRSCDHAGEAR